MFTIVITGGLGAGKSTAAAYFRSRGATVIDLDTVGHDVLRPGSPTLARVSEEFGDAIVGPDGTLDRSELARRAFADKDSAARLNAIVHPAIAAQIGPALRDVQLLSTQPEVVVLEVPLLAEAPVYRELADVVLAIAAPTELRIPRGTARGLEERDVRQRVALQATDDARAELADVVIENTGEPTDFIRALERFWDDVVLRNETSE